MPLERIVVGTDFSQHALSAAEWVSHQLAPNALMTLVHALHVPAPPGFLRQRSRDTSLVTDEAEQTALSKMMELSGSFPPAHTRTLVRRGRAHEVLMDIAAAEAADLLVVGAHGERSESSRLLGTTADRLARLSPVPLLVYTGVPRLVPRRILAAVDDSAEAASVMRLACTLCDPVEGEVRLLHVLSTAAYSHALSMSAIGTRDEDEAQDRMRDELRVVAQHWLDELARAVCSPPRVCAEVVHGDVSAAILADAQRWGAEIIVLGRHGSGSGPRLLLGGSVRRVLHECDRSVAVVPRPPREG